MKKSAVLAILGFALCATPVLASEELAKKNACTACHAIDKKLVGPAYKEVAAKYAKDPKAEAMLAAKVKAGGTGVWGQVPMPPNPQVKDEDIKAIVKWILALK
jgi:cytochrome c